MNDFSIQLGKDKCLITLRASLSQMRREGFNLSHEKTEVLDLVVTKKTNNELVTERLDKVSGQVGIPVQIVSDHGSDIKKGNGNFCRKHPQVVFTYDISHKTACLLKALLENNEEWKSLLKNINIVLLQVQQTELAFLRPILPRKKARYLNISIIVNWVKNILDYKAKGDFSLIGSGYMLHPESIFILIEKSMPQPSLHQTKTLLATVFKNKEDALKTLAPIFQRTINEKMVAMID